MSRKRTKPPATMAPSMEMDELEKSASKQEVKQGDYTQVTKLVIDRVPDEE
ncbi:MAG TPA: hypothetical protein VJ824_09940 [Bacillota bacterium]|nr:hypothetical protein [Bacillota bacterium]